MVHDPARPVPWSDRRFAVGTADKRALYRDLQQELAALIDGEPDSLANVANAAAAIYHSLPEVTWAGFYLLRGETLVLGPFQGHPACVRIPLGRGVCGTAAAGKRAIVVADVEAFPGHIACDPRSRSELVVPVHRNGHLLGVLDLDSPVPSRFDTADQAGCEGLVALIAASLADLLTSS